jgi:phage terminase large subunit-like protein
VGEQGHYGTGMIPAHTIHHISRKSGAPGAVDTAWVKHVSGGVSTLGLKSYEQRREAFQGTSIEVIWLDEEPDQDIVTECLLRTMDTPTMPGGGLLMLTFTPLKGMTPLILSFLQDPKQAR